MFILHKEFSIINVLQVCCYMLISFIKNIILILINQFLTFKYFCKIFLILFKFWLHLLFDWLHDSIDLKTISGQLSIQV